MNIMEYFQSPVSIRLGMSLAHFLWQGLLIACVAQLLVFRKRSANFINSQLN